MDHRKVGLGQLLNINSDLIKKDLTFKLKKDLHDIGLF